jgi:general secretion pathway protein A
LLSNIETPSQKLLPLVLVGQSELAVRLKEPSLRQLLQRVALRCEIGPFRLTETAAYIARRIEQAGGVPERLFTREAVVSIHEYSRGIARTISVICDNALMSGMVLNRRRVDRAIVFDVCRDFALRSPLHVSQDQPALPAGVRPPGDKIDLVSSPAPQDASRTVADEGIDTPNTPDGMGASGRVSLFGSGLS